MSHRPGASAFERLGEAVESFALLQRALVTIADEDDRRAKLSKAAAARAGQIEQELRSLAGLGPRRRGRALEEIPPIFLQKVRTLHEELGWGRPRILAAMRDEGATDWMVRRALAEFAGEKSGSRRGSQ